MDVANWLSGLSEQSRRRYGEEQSILSFDQYANLFARAPALLGRSSAQYLKDAIDCFGAQSVERPAGTSHRFGLFDTPFDRGRDRLIGQEEVQEKFYAILSNFVREGRTARFILLHGPNGSAKSSFVQCLARALVHYSKRPEGAVYSFSWVFPRSAYAGKKLGFGAGEGRSEDTGTTFAFAGPDDVMALVPADLRDHPIFLVPKEQRKPLLESLAAEAGLPEGFRFSEHLLEGDLSPSSRRIFEALQTAHGGDLRRVLAHVRVERFHFSRRYRRGVVTIEPQMHVDAELRQVTMDESYSNLPPALRHVAMSQLSGDLVDANRGLIEYDDLLKRPLDAFKYLLGTCETGRVPVGAVILYLDLVFVGTSNDKYVHAFMKLPEFPSFKGRMEFVRVPYLRDYRIEQGIYDMQVTPEVVGRHIAPHATHVAALWAVLTRLKKPDADQFAPAVRTAVSHLTPLEKADLYALGCPPSELRPEVARELQQLVPALFNETADRPDYEGAVGASPREIKTLLFNAAQAEGFACLHPVRVLDEILELTKMRSMYEFLQVPASGEYHDPVALWSRVAARYADTVAREFKAAMGLVTDDEFERQLQKYAMHASAWLKKERVVDPHTRDEMAPDESFLKEIESHWQITENRERVRQEFMGRIASFSLDHPGAEPTFRTLFADQFEKLRRHYFTEHQPEYDRMLRVVLDYLDGIPQEAAEKDAAASVARNMIDRYGYCKGCLGPTVAFLAREEK